MDIIPIVEIEELVEITETMALQHSYPGFDVRSLPLGLPAAAVNAPGRLFAQALKQKSVVTKLAALRWFWQRPGVAKRHAAAITECLTDKDEWVRKETAHTLGRITGLSEETVIALSGLLADADASVRKAAAAAVGKLGLKHEKILSALRKATLDPETDVKWKAEKALRKLGDYA